MNEGDISCPRCGNQFSSETKFECPFCGELVERGSVECPSCRVNYGEFREKTQARGGDESIDALLLEIIQLEAQSARTETKKFSCPGCSWMLDSETKWCPRCGRDLTAEEEAFQCPICGSAVSDDATTCPECGISFVTEEAAEGPARSSLTAADSIMEAMDSLVRIEKAPKETTGAPELEPEPVRSAMSEGQTTAPAPDVAGPRPLSEPKEAEKERPSPEPHEEIPEVFEERAATAAKASQEAPQANIPLRVIAKPAPKPKEVSTPEPKPERPEPTLEQEPEPAEEPAAPQPKKPKQRKLKTRTPKQK